MSDCYTPDGYRWVFSERSAKAQARRYRRRGLDAISRRILELLSKRGLGGASVLEIGGGIGAMQIELLRLGASRATSLELTPTYEVVAGELLRNAGLAGRVTRRVLDFAAAGGEVEAADVVLLNRVVCCYPDMPRLTGAAAEHTRRVLVLSFPANRWYVRLALGFGNLLLRALRRGFHIFVHPPEGIVKVAEQHGLRPFFNRAGPFWQVTAFERP